MAVEVGVSLNKFFSVIYAIGSGFYLFGGVGLPAAGPAIAGSCPGTHVSGLRVMVKFGLHSIVYSNQALRLLLGDVRSYSPIPFPPFNYLVHL